LRSGDAKVLRRVRRNTVLAGVRPGDGNRDLLADLGTQAAATEGLAEPEEASSTAGDRAMVRIRLGLIPGAF